MDKSNTKLPRLPRGFTAPHALAGLNESAPVLVALSGGADSTALLHMTAQYASVIGFRVYAAHLNHSIRGEEADRDEAFCDSLCKSLGVTFFSRKINVPALAKEQKKSVETAARDARYEFFGEIMSSHNIPILATAHNANDNLETMIFNLARGCGAEGMCGIPTARRFNDGMLVRPILSMSRREILEYCDARSLNFVVDSTNADTDYTRNKIRAQIIPVLEQINPEVTKSASRLAESLKADSLCLSSMTDWFLEELEEDCSIAAEKICGAPSAVSSRAIRALFEEASGGGTLEHTHVEKVNRLCRAAVPHSSIDLPCGVTARIENQRLFLKKAKRLPPPQMTEFYCKLHKGVNLIPECACEIFIGNSQNEKNIYKNSILLYLDSDKINGTLFARNRRAQDKIFSGRLHKDVRKLIGGAKIPLELRPRLPILCDDDGIVAVPYCTERDGARSTKDSPSALYVRITFN